jgi:DNA-binding PadR family transcriptional regulator
MTLLQSEFAILDQIARKPNSSGPEIVHALNASYSRPTVYRLLAGLEESKLIASDLSATGRPGPPQRRYGMTPSGKKVHTAAKNVALQLRAVGHARNRQQAIFV